MKVLKKMQVLTFIDQSTLFLSKLNKVYAFDLETFQHKEFFRFKTDLITLLSGFSSVLRRLFRKDIRLALKIDNDQILLVKNKTIYRLDLNLKKIKNKVKLPNGSRPLNMTVIESLNGFDDGIYFGEYFGNPLKKSVAIYKYSKEDKLIKVYRFAQGEINHIHNLVADRYRDCIWMLAGDTSDSAAIYQIKDNFKIVERVVFGKQEYRSCVLFPLEDGLLYATDSQFQQNSIRLLKLQQNKWESIHVSDINGPCIFGTNIQETFFFSTSVEGVNSGNILKQLLRNKPGPGIKKNQSEIVGGNLQNGFKTIYFSKKDIFPYVLFQFGNIIFPIGYNPTKKLFFTSIALKNNDFSTNIIEYEV